MNTRAAFLLVALAAPACGNPRPIVAPGPQTSSAAPAAVDQLRRDIDRLLTSAALERGTWGVLVKSLSRDDTLYSLNARKLLTPASNMKIVTLAVAAERLGWDFRYETRLVAAGSIHDGVLDGDLVAVGSGDPSIEDWELPDQPARAAGPFRAWADRLKALGVQVVTGRIVGDDRAFAGEPFGIGWAWDDLNHSYATAIGALQFNENSARLIATPADQPGQPATVVIQQAGSGLALRSAVTTSSPGTPASLATRRLAGSPLLDVRGSVAAGGRPTVLNLSVLNPTTYFVTALRDAIVKSGIEVRGGAVGVDDISDWPRVEGPPLVTHPSPPLSTLAVTMMKNSQNLYAETLFRTLGGTLATFDAARSVSESVLRGWGIGPSDIVIADGSGLSRNDLITPEALVTILTRVDRDPRMRDTFERALPIAGVDGTLAQHMAGTPAERNVRAKTGSFSNARSLSGYVSGADGEPLVFSIITNNYASPAEIIEKTEDAIAVRLAQFSRR